MPGVEEGVHRILLVFSRMVDWVGVGEVTRRALEEELVEKLVPMVWEVEAVERKGPVATAVLASLSSATLSQKRCTACRRR